MTSMQRWLSVTTGAWLVATGLAGVVFGQASESVTAYSSGGELLRPADFREWVFLGSGLGMTYTEPAAASTRPPAFTNVFVNPASYQSFLKTGTWPERSMFILEIRGSASEGSINRGGRFQTDVLAVEAAVKDNQRFAGGWAYFDFGRAGEKASPLPQTERCYACHKANAAVEQTFVQFYPTMMEVAKRLGTVNAGYKADAAPHADHR